MHQPAIRARSFWPIVLACAAMMAATTGIRLSLGLFVRPIAATGMGIAWISLVLAVGQFSWGAAQPLFGILSERIGARLVLMQGTVLLALGLALTPMLQNRMGLLLTLGLVFAAGAGAASFAILIGAAAQRVEASRRALASGFINAGGSFRTAGHRAADAACDHRLRLVDRDVGPRCRGA